MQEWLLLSWKKPLESLAEKWKGWKEPTLAGGGANLHWPGFRALCWLPLSLGNRTQLWLLLRTQLRLHESPDGTMLPQASRWAATWLWKEGHHYLWFQLRQYCNLFHDLLQHKCSPQVYLNLCKQEYPSQQFCMAGHKRVQINSSLMLHTTNGVPEPADSVQLQRWVLSQQAAWPRSHPEKPPSSWACY